MRLQKKLALLVITFGLLCALVTTFTFYHNVTKILVSSELENLNEQLKIHGQLVEKAAEQLKYDLTLLSKQFKSSNYHFIATFIRSKPIYLEIKYRNALTAKNNLMLFTREGKKIKTLPKTESNFSAVKDRNIFYSTSTKKSGIDRYFAQANFPLFTGEKLQGILSITFNIKDYFFKSGPERHLRFLIDPDNKQLIHYGTKMTSDWKKVLLTTTKSFINSDKISLTFGPMGIDERFIVLSKIRLSTHDNDFFILGQTVTYSQIINNTYQTLGVVITTIVCSILILTVLGLILGNRYLLQPIVTLTNTTREIIRRDVHVISDIKTGDELKILALNFNQMVYELFRRKQELAKSNANLEKLVAARTNKLKETNHKLVLANSASREFLATMSHEVRTPLNAINGMVALVLDTKLNLEQKKYVNILQKASNNLLELVSNILDFTKIENKQIDIRTTTFNLYELLQHIQQLVSPLAKDKNLKISFDISPDIPQKIHTDQNKLQQVILNIMSNSVKFTDQGSITLKVTNRPNSKWPINLCFAISNNDFTQHNISQSYKLGVSGLGPTITKQLIKILHGKIWFESTINKGTTLFFQIPSAPLPAQKLSTPKVVQPTTIPQRGKILLAEDITDNRILIKAYLKNSCFTVDEAENGKLALEKFTKYKYDLILMDIQMPIMDGIDATKKIREWEKENNLAETPIVALSAYAFKQDIEKSLTAGCNEHLTKPIIKTTLITTLLKHTNSNSTATSKSAHL